MVKLFSSVFTDLIPFNIIFTLSSIDLSLFILLNSIGFKFISPLLNKAVWYPQFLVKFNKNILLIVSFLIFCSYK